MHKLKVCGWNESLGGYRTPWDLVDRVIVRKREKCLHIDGKRKMDKAQATQTVELT